MNLTTVPSDYEIMTPMFQEFEQYMWDVYQGISGTGKPPVVQDFFENTHTLLWALYLYENGTSSGESFRMATTEFPEPESDEVLQLTDGNEKRVMVFQDMMHYLEWHNLSLLVQEPHRQRLVCAPVHSAW